MEWVYLTHEKTGGATTVADEPGVVAWHEARGWAKTDPPKPVPFVPPADGGQQLIEQEWVELIHPAFGGRATFPNHPEALEEALNNGWLFSLPTKTAAKPKKSSGKAPVDEESEEVSTDG